MYCASFKSIELCYVALLLLMQPHNRRWSKASSDAVGHRLCQATSAVISGVASMPEQGKNKKGACVAFLLSVNIANLGHHTKAVLEG